MVGLVLRPPATPSLAHPFTGKSVLASDEATSPNYVVQARRNAVLNAANSVFEAKGFEQGSIRLIAKAAGVTTGAIYPYFKGKRHIYAELLATSLDTMRAELIRMATVATNDEDRFCTIVQAFFAYYETRPNDLYLALHLFKGLKPQGLGPELNELLNMKAVELLNVVKSAIQAVAPIDDRDAELELGLQMSFVLGLLMLHHTNKIGMLRVNARELLALHLQHTVARLAAPLSDRQSR